jgi:hypothetical protein
MESLAVRRGFKLVGFLVVLALAACGDDDDDFGFGGAVGAPCRNDRDCPARCEDGLCTVDCEHDGHCPPGTACVDDHGGVCAPLCGSSAACGRGFECTSRNRRGADGSVDVCRG